MTTPELDLDRLERILRLQEAEDESVRPPFRGKQPIVIRLSEAQELIALARRTVAAEQERDRLREALEDLDEFARYRAGYYQARETLRAREALASLTEEQKP